jgi:polyisoprenoid-binding protein YceI
MNLKTRLSLALAAVSLLPFTPAVAADTYTVDAVHSEASFQIRHLVGKVRGHFVDFRGTVQVDQAKPEASSVDFSIKTATIDTGVADRDKHLRTADFFDVEKFPEITFKSTKVAPAGKDKYNVTGTFTMHGVSKTVTIPVSFLGFVKDPWGNERAGFEVTTTLNRKDYGIVWNKTLDAGGVMLGEDVAVTITVETVKKKDKPAA